MGLQEHQAGMSARVTREATRYFATRMSMSARTSILGYGMHAVLLQKLVPGEWLIGWVATILVFEIFNGIIAGRLQHSLDDPPRCQRLFMAQTLGLGLAGGTWGLVPWLPGLHADMVAYLFSVLFLVVISIFAVHNLCLHWPSMTAFTLGLSLPTFVGAFYLPVQAPVLQAFTAVGTVLMTQLYGRMTRQLLLSGIQSQITTTVVAEQLRHKNEELTDALTTIRRMASVDPLTQCLNRRALTDSVDEVVRRQRANDRIGLVLMDIDHFKRVNDTHGHAAGDAVLVMFADRVRALLRAEDRLARWGGEEFLCVIPDADLPMLLRLAERIRSDIEARPMLSAPQELHATVSLGVSLCDHGQDFDQAVEHADQALYRAKNSGRNRVCAYEAL